MLLGFDFDSFLKSLMRRRIVSLLLALCIFVLVISYLSAFSALNTELSILNLLMGEMSFAFLSISFMLPSLDTKRVIKLSIEFLVLMAVLFLLLVLIPSGEGAAPFSFKELTSSGTNNGDNTSYSSPIIIINGFVLLLVNLVGLGILYAKEKYMRSALGEDSEEPAGFNSFKKADFTALIAEEPEEEIKNKQQLLISRKIANELKDEVSEIFDVYLKKLPDKPSVDNNEKLTRLEQTLLKYINPNITAAACLDESSATLERSIFFWDETNKEELINSFHKFNQASQLINTGKVCQALIASGGLWYLIAEFQGNYLLLKSRNKDYAPLLDTAHKVFKHLN